jgi:hypothetical protein
LLILCYQLYFAVDVKVPDTHKKIKLLCIHFVLNWFIKKKH